MTKVYLVTEDVDSGYRVIDVYASLDDIPFAFEPTYNYKWAGQPLRSELVRGDIIPDTWQSTAVDNYNEPLSRIYAYELK